MPSASGCARAWRRSAREMSAERPRAFLERWTEGLEQSLPARFEQQVARMPDHPAVRTEAGHFTYRALNRAANRVARTLHAACGGAHEPVALLFENGASAIVASLGALKAGKIGVPLDTSYPAARLAALLAHSEARALLTDAASRPLGTGLAAGVLPVIDLDAIDETVSGDDNLDLPIAPDAVERIGYTSGSTGHPKGVYRTHRAALHNALTYALALGLGPADRLLVLFSYNRVTGLVGIGALLSGTTLVPFDVRARGLSAAAELLARDDITVYYSTPTVFRALGESLRGAVRFPSLRLIELTGEPVTRSDVDLYRALTAEDCLLLNHLGSTEAGFYRQYFVTHRTVIEGPLVPAGYATPDKKAFLLDDAGQEVAPGEVGEIVVRSRYLSSGYWRDPDLTRQAFVPAPDGNGERLYRTGDVGRMLPDGCLVYLGRKDAQVKVRGYRVEPAEVEGALREHPQVRDVAVVGRSHPATGEMRLVAYVASRGPAPPAGDLRLAVRRVLPEYMVPAAVVFVDALPRLPGGKVDRKSLPEPACGPSVDGGARAAPADAVQRQMAAIWAEVLGVHPIGPRDDFFELGGDSLRAARILNQIEETWGVRLPLSTFLEHATVQDVAALLAASAGAL
jgi:amino acid adenylation domain-containing protein